ncbi:MAG: hypothetical protein GY845_08680 [Planctomycetes bacterium]|nr:hypothetical protein [Planctomycetota bacterium]
MKITPQRDPFIQLLARWLVSGFHQLIGMCFWAIILFIAIAILGFCAKIVWFFAILILNALGGF